jgi:hypothetical protein
MVLLPLPRLLVLDSCLLALNLDLDLDLELNLRLYLHHRLQYWVLTAAPRCSLLAGEILSKIGPDEEGREAGSQPASG